MWNVLRVAYFENDKSRILLGPIADVVEQIKHKGLPVYVTSHWKFGPHIDVLVECDKAVFESDIYPACSTRINAWLAENPSKTELVPEQYEKLSYQLAMSELEPPPYLPLMNNNSVLVARYERSQSINIEGFHDTKERFLVGSTPLLFALLKLKQADSNVFFTTLVYMLAASAAQFRPDGIRRGYISFRSHAEYFFENYDQGDQLRAKFDALDKNYAPFIDANIQQVAEKQVDATQLHPGQKAILSSWQEVLDNAFEDNLSVVNSNYESIISEDNDVSSTEQNFGVLAEQISSNVPDEINKPSREYNTGKVVNSAMNHEEGRRLFRSHEFIAYRTTVNYFYLLLPVLDITPIQKFSICHLVANSVERVYKIDWKDVIPAAVGGSNE
ncbi:lantibiotic dehydratase C-terminal domain-containing protein [Alteromonas sp. a30]|uniref:lantibiotic dehydratase C-terminal domain-containing protein n=1 Tax=Alteromonas sp. a30 TaxID=2730917 RepID=UPI00227EB2EA|nr:lantibiotic dehydratase C-terminal domain-containing protein [Alteromonas sp. a30]MCY7294753.1 hypothetical protein [Alteromonas sp. a30]